jgi:methylase of polypeptide subunit release factors
MGFLVLRDGSLEIKGSNKPDFTDLATLCPEWQSQYDLGSAFYKPDYFVPFPTMEGLSSAE